MQEGQHIDPSRIPTHIAVIMDGNGRWAEQQGAARSYGHKQALEAVKDTITGCVELGVSYLTLYAFSTENWKRPKQEVNTIMQLLVSTLQVNMYQIMEQNVRLTCLGDLSMFPKHVRTILKEAISATRQHTRLQVCLALNYSGRWEILQAVRNIASSVQKGDISVDQIDEKCFRNFLGTSSIPDPELLIRTSGEQRISNFLLWQIAYTELYITEVLWPDFRKIHLQEAIFSYQQRERRFGKISAQLRS